ncbi:MAG: dipeptidyl peptidase 3 [Bacteroidales bacterium]|nr:dipeptidyl peptidase 3 [Bacteroidales bacterium]
MKTTENDAIIDRFADIRILRYKVPGFEELTLLKKKLLYCLSEAALWGRDIFWHQNGHESLLMRKVMECLYAYNQDTRLEEFLKKIWFANGIYHHYSNDKFTPSFTQEEFKRWVGKVPVDVFLSKVGKTPDEIIARFEPVLFNPSFDAKKVNLKEGEDLVKTSAVNFYRKVTQDEVEHLYATTGTNPLNSQVKKLEDGTIIERVWRLGGMYDSAIQKIVYWLDKAVEYAEDEKQAEVIRLLIKYYKSGDLKDFDEFNIKWVQQKDSYVDFINGFIEVYNDPLGLKATWESIVELVDADASKQIELISRNAQWFEDHSPIDPEWRKKEVTGVSMNVISAVMLGGDCYPATPIGVNLPNADWIREQYGSKSISLANITHAYAEAAKGGAVLKEFAATDEEVARQQKYGEIADELHTQLHECLGHGSGQMAEGVTLDNLKAYGSTIEEARADLFALYFMADDKMQEIGVAPCKDAAWAHYDAYLRGGLLVQMARIEEGKDIEEAHMRNRQLISKWVIERAEKMGTAKIVEREGKHYVVISDYEALRDLFGQLLREIQRIKSTGDYEAAKAIVEGYGVKTDKALHHEVRERYAALNVAPFSGFVNPKMELVKNESGVVVDVKISYDETYIEQMLRYSRDYAL